MQTLDAIVMKNLSFHDFNVEAMEFLPSKKTLKGEWLEWRIVNAEMHAEFE